MRRSLPDALANSLSAPLNVCVKGCSIGLVFKAQRLNIESPLEDETPCSHAAMLPCCHAGGTGCNPQGTPGRAVFDLSACLTSQPSFPVPYYSMYSQIASCCTLASLH